MTELLTEMVGVLKESESAETLAKLKGLVEQGAPLDGDPADSLNTPVKWTIRFDRLEYLMCLVDGGATLTPDLMAKAYEEQSFKILRFLCERFEKPFLGQGSVFERLEKLARDFGDHCVGMTDEHGYHTELLEQEVSPEEVLTIIPEQEWEGSGAAWDYRAALTRAVEQLSEADRLELSARFKTNDDLEQHFFEIFKKQWTDAMGDAIAAYGK